MDPSIDTTGNQVQSCPSDGCTLDADVILRSSDGILYAAHSKNLDMYTEGFPPPELAACTHIGDEREVVQLTESAAVLAVLLQFVHKQRQPDSSLWDFNTLAGVAEAAEKYQVYSAMQVCYIRMELAMPLRPLEILAYAQKHNYPQLGDASARLTLSTPLKDVEAIFQDVPHVFIAWVKYREGFVQALDSLLQPRYDFPDRDRIRLAILDKLKGRLHTLDRSNIGACIETVPVFYKNYKDTVKVLEWSNPIADQVSLLPPLSSFL